MPEHQASHVLPSQYLVPQGGFWASLVSTPASPGASGGWVPSSSVNSWSLAESRPVGSVPLSASPPAQVGAPS